VSLQSSFETISNFYLVFNFVDGCDLFTSMDKGRFWAAWRENRRKSSINGLMLFYIATETLRSPNDVKLDNCLLDEDGKMKLIDFGLASMDKDGEKAASILWDLQNTVAPEIIGSKTYSGTKADVYSLGLSTACCLDSISSSRSNVSNSCGREGASSSRMARLS
jgi:serine/threonine protein kinase